MRKPGESEIAGATRSSICASSRCLSRTSIPCDNMVKSKMRIFSSLRQYLLTLKPSQLPEMYSHPATCLAVFRDLPELAKQFIMRLLFIEQPIHQQMINSWVTKTASSELEEAVQVIKDLKLWSETPGGLPSWILNDTFRKGLRTCVFGGGDGWIVQTTSNDKHAKDVESLDSYAMERWEMVLHYMVGSKQLSNPKEKVGADTIATLVTGGLVTLPESSAGEAAPLITADGFQFLLLDTSSQVWYFVTKYLELVESKGLSLVECLTFMFQLSFCTLGQVYSTENLSPNVHVLLQNLREFGLVFQRKRKDGKFYPTRLVINLFSGLRNKEKDVSKPGYLIVETNYRVYAYTDSPLQIALLAIFTHMNYRFPGFCLGMLTRESVRSALKSGITASQITNFLTVNAHPAVCGNEGPRVPPSISDQIRLWEKERDRYVIKDGYLYSQFLSQSEFEVLRNYARDSGFLIWDNPTKRSVVVSIEGHEDVRLFWKRHKKGSKEQKKL